MTDNDFNVGDIVYATYTWDDVRIPHFFKVLKSTGKTITIRELKKKRVSGDFHTGTELPLSRFIPGEKVKNLRKNKFGKYALKYNTWGNNLQKFSGNPVHSSLGWD